MQGNYKILRLELVLPLQKKKTTCRKFYPLSNDTKFKPFGFHMHSKNEENVLKMQGLGIPCIFCKHQEMVLPLRRLYRSLCDLISRQSQSNWATNLEGLTS
jgi:hypothetical protein